MSSTLKTCPSGQGKISKLGPHDVIMGRGAAATDYQGNLRLRDLVSQRQEEYAASDKRSDKHRIAQEIVDKVHQLGGRFLQCEDTLMDPATFRRIPIHAMVWEQVIDRSILSNKLKQLLRDAAPIAKSRRKERRKRNSKRAQKAAAKQVNQEQVASCEDSTATATSLVEVAAVPRAQEAPSSSSPNVHRVTPMVRVPASTSASSSSASSSSSSSTISSLPLQTTQEVARAPAQASSSSSSSSMTLSPAYDEDNYNNRSNHDDPIMTLQRLAQALPLQILAQSVLPADQAMDLARHLMQGQQPAPPQVHQGSNNNVEDLLATLLSLQQQQQQQQQVTNPVLPTTVTPMPTPSSPEETLLADLLGQRSSSPASCALTQALQCLQHMAQLPALPDEVVGHLFLNALHSHFQQG